MHSIQQQKHQMLTHRSVPWQSRWVYPCWWHGGSGIHGGHWTWLHSDHLEWSRLKQRPIFKLICCQVVNHLVGDYVRARTHACTHTHTTRKTQNCKRLFQQSTFSIKAPTDLLSSELGNNTVFKDQHFGLAQKHGDRGPSLATKTTHNYHQPLTWLAFQQMLRLCASDFWHSGEHMRAVYSRSLHAIAVINLSVTGFFVQVELQDIKRSSVCKRITASFHIITQSSD